jgi:hypothetical protein
MDSDAMAFEFFRKLFAVFKPEKDRGRGRLLKKIAKDIQDSRFARFYKPKTIEAQPAMAKYFYDIYKNLAHAQVFLQSADNAPRLKLLTVEAFLDMKFLDARQRLNADYVEERAAAMPIAEVSRLLKEDLTILAGAFDEDFISRVDRCYNRILAVIQFAAFDFYVFLRKFDPALQERNFSTPPRFKPVRGEQLEERIKDFLDAACPIENDSDWTMPLQVLKAFKNGLDAVREEDWISVLAQLRDLRRASILELMIRHICQDPYWEFKTRITQEHIAEAYLKERRQEVESAVSGFLSSQRKIQVGLLAQELFGDPNIKRLQNYTEEANESFIQAGAGGFAYTQILNYLKVFLIDFFQEDMQNLCELLLIRGHWSSTEQSKEMSETFHNLLNNMDQLLALEESLGEDGEEGFKIRSTLLKSGRNQIQLKYLNTMIRSIDERVRDLLNNAAESLLLLGRQFKEILQDSKNDGVYIINYRELQKESEPPLTQRIVLNYKRIYTYLQLQMLIIGPEDSTADSLAL